MKGNKDDTRDSKWIGDLFRIGLVNSSFIPDKDSRISRELTHYRCKLTSMKSSEKNRFQNAFTVCNAALDSVVSGYVWKIRCHLHYIEKLIERVDICIKAMVEKYDGAVSLLCTILGIDRRSAITVISEIGVDMAQFGSSKRLCCQAGPPLATTNPPARRSLSVFHMREFISNLRWCKSPTQP